MAQPNNSFKLNRFAARLNSGMGEAALEKGTPISLDSRPANGRPIFYLMENGMGYKGISEAVKKSQ